MNGSYNAKPRYAVTHHGNIEDERAPLALSLTLLPPVPSIHPVGPRVERARGHRGHCPLTLSLSLSRYEIPVFFDERCVFFFLEKRV